jgi:uncharacterized membrane protein YkgB
MEEFNKKLESLDEKILINTRRWVLPVSKFSIFLVYFWFGALKVFSNSPANPLVASLLESTLPGVSFESFIIAFGVFEMIIGLLFIIPRLERLAIFILSLHLITTIMPLFLLPEVTWQGFLTPTLEGQYIIKNILIVALAIGIFSHLHSYKKTSEPQNA